MHMNAFINYTSMFIKSCSLTLRLIYLHDSASYNPMKENPTIPLLLVFWTLLKPKSDLIIVRYNFFSSYLNHEKVVLVLAKIVPFITPTIFARKPLENVVIVA